MIPSSTTPSFATVLFASRRRDRPYDWKCGSCAWVTRCDADRFWICLADHVDTEAEING
jgi:hypothetical protein